MTWSLPEQPSDAVEVFLLGALDWRAAVEIQRRLVFELSARDDRFGVVLLCEHPPGISIGRSGDRADVIATRHELSARQMKVHRSNHGGSTLVQLPGQLAVYPILPLDRLQISLSEYREVLENSLLAGCEAVKVSAEAANGTAPGITSRWGNLANIGVAVRGWVSYYGGWLNVNPAMEAFDLINTGDRNASLETALGRPVSMGTVREAVANRLTERLRYHEVHFSTALPSLIRRTQPVYDFARSAG